MEPQFVYDPVTNEYHDSQTGEVVTAAIILAWLMAVSQNAGRSARELTQLLRQGDITLKAWQLEMATNIRYAHLANAAAAKGGLLQLTMADYLATQKIIARELTYLDNFAKGIADGSIPLDGHVLRRADAYMKASRSTYWETLRRDQVKRGASEEKRVMAGSEHCPECVEYAGREWVPIGTLPPPGVDSTCRQNCLCRLETR